jgi:homoserine dehydrogenase
MKKYHIIHFGIGNVGKTFIAQLFANREKIKRDFDIDLQYCGMFGSKGGFFKSSGFSEAEVKKNVSALQIPKITDPLPFLKSLNNTFSKNAIIVNTTTSSEMVSILSYGLKNGLYAVASNKRPLAQSQSEFEKLQKYGKSRFRFETTVGAGLPVISILKQLLATGDEIVEISGCFSGTLGFICTSLENGMSFSNSVRFAKEKGFTETDPREDLSGTDVARKAIIFARLLGKEIEIDELAVTSFFPESFKKYSVAEFMDNAAELDNKYATLFSNAAKNNNALRYIATVTKKKVSVGLKEVPKNSTFGSLSGPDNMIVFKTKRYFDNPLIIQGPGAGLEVTAAGVFGDILALVAGI